MNALTDHLPQRAGFAVIGVAAVLLVAASIVMTRLLDLAPCPLCIFQRMLYLVLAVFALAAALWPRTRYWTGGLALVTAVGGVATAAHQSWMQAFPANAFSCGPGEQNLIERFVEWAGTQVPWLFFAWGECSSREWELLGLSIANWSIVAFLGLGVMLALLLTGRSGRLIP